MALPMGGSLSVKGGIPYEAKARWLDDHGYFGDQRQRAEGLFHLMDNTYAEVQAERLANGGGDDEDGD